MSIYQMSFLSYTEWRDVLARQYPTFRPSLVKVSDYVTAVRLSVSNNQQIVITLIDEDADSKVFINDDSSGVTYYPFVNDDDVTLICIRLNRLPVLIHELCHAIVPRHHQTDDCGVKFEYICANVTLWKQIVSIANDVKDAIDIFLKVRVEQHIDVNPWNLNSPESKIQEGGAL